MEAVTRQKRHIVSVQRKSVARQAFTRIMVRNIVDIKAVLEVRTVIKKYKGQMSKELRN
jgi:hypothetical protein